MACITERPRAGKPSAWQVVIRVKGMDAVHQSFPTEELAKEFVAAAEPALRERARKESKALEKLRRLDPQLTDFYGRRLRDVISEFAFGMTEADRARAIAPSLSGKQSRSGAATMGKPPKKKTYPAHLLDIGSHRHCVATVLAHIGEVTVREAKSSWVVRYVDKMRATRSNRGRPYSYETIGKHIQLMRAACLAAAMRSDVEEPRLHFTTKCFPKKCIKARARRLESGEHELIMARLRQDRTVKGRQWRCLYRLALETGARLQELTLAQWREIDWRGAWIIPAEHTKMDTARIVPLSPRARRVVALLRATRATESKLLFHSFGTNASVSKAWAYRAERAGVVDLRFHDLRHEAVSRLMAHSSGIRPQDIKQMVGHKSDEMLANYTHLRVAEYIGLLDKQRAR